MSEQTRQSITRMLARAKVHALHYLIALVASSWNAGIAALVVSLGLAGAAAVEPDTITPLDWPQMYAAFKYGAIINALFYLRNHPLPEKLPSETPPPFPA